MKNLKIAFAAVFASLVSVTPVLAVDVLGSTSDLLIADGCLIPDELTSTVVSGAIDLNAIDTLNNLVLEEGDTYDLLLNVGIADAIGLDAACITDGEVEITYTFTPEIDDVRLDVGPETMGTLLDSEVATGVDFVIPLTVIDGAVGGIESFDAGIQFFVDVQVSYDETVGPLDITE